MPRRSAASLRPEAEAVWAQIRAEFALHDGFWLAFLFGAQQHEIAEFVARSQDLARGQARYVDEIAVTRDVASALAALFRTRPDVTATWLTDEFTSPPEERNVVWSLLLRRLNERRNVLLRARPGGVLISCPAGALPMVRDSAPDLWSFRVLTAPFPAPAMDPRGWELGGVPAPSMTDFRYFPAPRGGLTRRVRHAAPGTLVAQVISGGITVGPQEGRTVQFGRNAHEVYVCIGTDDRDVSHQHGVLICSGDRWWVRNIGRSPMRLAARQLLPDEEPIPLTEGYTPLFVQGSSRREHLLELYVVGSDGGRSTAQHDGKKQMPGIWPLSDDEQIALIVLGQQYLRHEPSPQPLSWRQAVDQLAELQPGTRWTIKRLEHMVGKVRGWLSRSGVAGLTRDEVPEPVGNALNDNLIRELILSGTLVPPDLARLDAEREGTVAGGVLAAVGRASAADHEALVSVEGNPIQPSPDIEPLLRRTSNALRAGRIQDAVVTAWETMGAATEADDRTLSYAWLAQVRSMQGEPLDAQQYAEIALAARRPLGREMVHSLYGILAGSADPAIALPAAVRVMEFDREAADRHPGAPEAVGELAMSVARIARIHELRGDLDTALTGYTEALDLRRRVCVITGDTPEALRDLSVALNHVARMEEQLGDLDTALSGYSEALDIAHGLDASGAAPDALRDLSFTLNHVARIRERRGDLDTALTGYTEALDMRRRIHTTAGDTPEALRDVSVALNHVAHIHERRGDLDIALAGYTEALDLARRAAAIGRTAEDLRDLLVSLNRVARVHEQRGDPRAALTGYTEALDLARRIHHAGVDEPPRALRDLMITLTRAARTQERLYDLDSALAGHTEALDIARRLHAVTGDVPQSLRDLSGTLRRVARIHETRGQLDAALAGYTEALAQRRRADADGGEDAGSLRDLSRYIDHLAGVQERLGELDAAMAGYTESLDLARRIHAVTGDTPQSLRDHSTSLGNLAEVQRERGDLDSALDTYTEALELDRRIYTAYGETPDALRNLSATLTNVAETHESLGNLDTARARYSEADAALGRLSEHFGLPYWDRPTAERVADAVRRLDTTDEQQDPPVAPSQP